MRILMAGAALAAALVLAGQARAIDPTNVHTRAPSNSGFGFSVSRLLGTITSTVAPSTTPKPPPIVQPQVLSPINTSLRSFLPSPKSPLGTPFMGISTYPSEDQLPGAAYLKAFHLRVAPRVPIN